jgi:hypothetical protein
MYMYDGLEKLVREEFKPLDSVKAVYDLYSKYGLISLVVKQAWTPARTCAPEIVSRDFLR